MRWLLGILLLLSAESLWAQSLGDVARAQREDNAHSKPKHVFTNSDLDGFSESSTPDPTEKSPTQPAKSKPQSMPVYTVSAQQRRITELNQQAQSLDSEIRDLQSRISALRGSATFGDPNRARETEESRQLSIQLDAKRSELANVRNELQEESQRAQQSSVVK